MVFDSFEFSADIFHHKPQMFYLIGYLKAENSSHIVASYSVWTKQLIIKNASFCIPGNNTLRKFVERAELRYQKKKEKK